MTISRRGMLRALGLGGAGLALGAHKGLANLPALVDAGSDTKDLPQTLEAIQDLADAAEVCSTNMGKAWKPIKFRNETQLPPESILPDSPISFHIPDADKSKALQGLVDDYLIPGLKYPKTTHHDRHLLMTFSTPVAVDTGDRINATFPGGKRNFDILARITAIGVTCAGELAIDDESADGGVRVARCSEVTSGTLQASDDPKMDVALANFNRLGAENLTPGEWMLLYSRAPGILDPFHPSNFPNSKTLGEFDERY